MKVLTFRLGQFAVTALFLTVLFRYVLNLCIEIESGIGALLCSVLYFCLMFLFGWYFGRKDIAENAIHDIGFRFHFVTYILCLGIGVGAYFIGWNTENLVAMKISALSWGMGLLVHFILYLVARQKTIKGYAKEEIFE